MNIGEKVLLVRAMSKGAEMLEDELVASYLYAAERAVMNKLHPFADVSGMTMPERYEYVQTRIAVYNINKRGAEGETKHIEVGTERDYASADIPQDLLSEIVPMCGVPM